MRKTAKLWTAISVASDKARTAIKAIVSKSFSLSLIWDIGSCIWRLFRDNHEIISSIIQIIGLPVIAWQLIEITKRPDLSLEFTKINSSDQIDFVVHNNEDAVAEYPEIRTTCYNPVFGKPEQFRSVVEYVRPASRLLPVKLGVDKEEGRAYYGRYWFLAVSCKNCPNERSYWLVNADTS